ncbi:MAG: FAD-dependent oxidoreductase [Candidatus Hydrogenedentes bacterium]|nr:FAD-dependent oxidoreductase [Candidatus Hydrogenedentota bacterium]
MRYVIVGTGAAGATAARTIKRMDRDGEVVIIGDERFFPYNRYLLTEFLSGAVSAAELFHTSEEFFEAMDIRLRKGQAVERVYPNDKTIRFAHNEVMSYDRLLIATGRSPSLGPVLRPYAKLIQRYYTFEDILLIQKRLPEVREVIVSGRGLSALDLIQGMYRVGKKITYITRGQAIDVSTVESHLMGDLDSALAEREINFVHDDRIVAIECVDNRYLVKTFQGKELWGDLVFAWDNYTPNVGCLRNTGIEVKTGILVDLRMRSSAPEVYAAGDCVEIYHPTLKNYWINFGWPNAVEQGRIAGKNMAGDNEEYQIHETTLFNILGKPLEARWWD